MTVLLLHAMTTWFMVGLIWLVQVVHYPLFAAVADGHRARYAREHGRRISWIVGPVMGVEASTALWLAVWPPQELRGSALPVIGVVLLAGIWLMTFFLQVPLHARLVAGGGPDVVTRLVRSNWLRTLAWTARGLLVAWMCRRFANA